MSKQLQEVKISGFQFGKTKICLTYIIDYTDIIEKSYRVTKNRRRIITTWNEQQAKSIYWREINNTLNQTTLNI